MDSADNRIEVQEMDGYYTRYSFRSLKGDVLEFVSEEEAREYYEDTTEEE